MIAGPLGRAGRARGVNWVRLTSCVPRTDGRRRRAGQDCTWSGRVRGFPHAQIPPTGEALAPPGPLETRKTVTFGTV